MHNVLQKKGISLDLLSKKVDFLHTIVKIQANARSIAPVATLAKVARGFGVLITDLLAYLYSYGRSNKRQTKSASKSHYNLA